MEYRSLLAVHTLHDHLDSLRTAVSLAQRFSAHLQVLVVNVAFEIPPMIYIQNPEFIWSNSFSTVLTDNRHRVEDVRNWFQDKGVSVEVNSSCQPLGLIAEDIAQQALYADLVLYTRCGESMVSGLMKKALEGAVFDAARPALVLAETPVVHDPPFSTISLAWDAVPGAMKAITASLPLLKCARNVELAVVSPDQDRHTLQADTLNIRHWLKRHGVDTELRIVHQNSLSVADALLDYINGSRRDLVVMGIYGHSRFTEKLFSGVSHRVLEHANTPLLIAH